MDKELMHKEVLCLLDTRQIQRFLFKSNSYLDTLGGGDLVEGIQEKAIRYAVEHVDPPLDREEYALSLEPDEEIPYLLSDRILFQLVSCGAGNALCLVRSGELCQRIIRKISRYYLDHAYCLNLAAAVTEKTDNFEQDIFHLYRKLNAIKASCDISDPAGALPVVIREPRTGLPAIGRDEQTGEVYSRASQLRRQTALQRSHLVDMGDMQTTPGFDGREYLAVIHADGNNMGITIARILQGTRSYREGIRARRQISHNIRQSFRQVMEESLAGIRSYYEALQLPGKGDFHHAFHICNQGGDDINIVCDARLAIPFVNLLFESLRGKLLWETEELTVPLYMCAGIAYVVREKSFHSACQLAVECCDSAKKAAKREENLRDGLAGNWIDFQICDTTHTQELALLREKAYVTKEQIHLQLRPYCLDPGEGEDPRSYRRFLERVRCLKEAGLTRQQQEAMRLSYMMGRKAFRRWILHAAGEGLDLTALLGRSLCRDGEDRLHATWFDATEMMDFV